MITIYLFVIQLEKTVGLLSPYLIRGQKNFITYRQKKKKNSISAQSNNDAFSPLPWPYLTFPIYVPSKAKLLRTEFVEFEWLL